MRYIAPPCAFSRSFPPTQEGVAGASTYLDEVIEGTNLSSLSPKLHIILDEICSNIVKHSRASGFEVNIGIDMATSTVKLTFSDDGMAYDPLSHADPDTTLPAEDRPIGGLGLMMVKKMSSSLSYRRAHCHNVLTVELGIH